MSALRSVVKNAVTVSVVTVKTVVVDATVIVAHAKTVVHARIVVVDAQAKVPVTVLR